MPLFSSCSGGLSREVAVVVAHLFLFSQLGVLTRIGLDSLFSATCGSDKRGFGTCLTSLGLGRDPFGAYFPDLPSNALGSFIMGLAAASSTLSLGAPKPLAALPASHPWQSSPELHIGVRTGFCGCLTTFSSWSSALFAQAAGGGGRPGGRWPQWLWGWVVGLYVALGSYAAGEHAARFLDDRLRPREERDAARADAQAARLAVERAPSIGVPWSGVVVATSEGEEGDDDGFGGDDDEDDEGHGASLLDGGRGGRGGGAGGSVSARALSSSIVSAGSSSASSATTRSRRRRRWLPGGGGGGNDVEQGGGMTMAGLSPSLTAPAAVADAPARAAARRLASTGEVSLPLSSVARHHASRAIDTLARRSSVLEQILSLRREADGRKRAAEQQQRHHHRHRHHEEEEEEREQEEREKAAEEANDEAIEATARAAEAVKRAEAIARGSAEEVAGASDLEQGRGAAAAAGLTSSTSSTTTMALSPVRRARAAAAAAPGLSSSRRSSSQAWRRPPPRAPSPEPGSTREVSITAAALSEKVTQGDAAATTTTSSATSSPFSATGAAAAAAASDSSPALRRPLAARAASMLRGGYRAAARAAEGGADAERNVAAYSFATKTNALAVLAAAALWVSFLLLFVLDEAENPSASRRGEWLAVVLAPVGCLLRWRLATLNYKLPGKWKFLPAGTLAANVGGCVVTFTVAAVLARRPPSSVWGAAVAKALQVGVAGSLSTVSTLSAEVTAQLRRAPADARGYAYLGITWVCAQVVGVVVYGSAVWSAPRK